MSAVASFRRCQSSRPSPLRVGLMPVISSDLSQIRYQMALIPEGAKPRRNRSRSWRVKVSNGSMRCSRSRLAATQHIRQIYWRVTDCALAAPRISRTNPQYSWNSQPGKCVRRTVRQPLAQETQRGGPYRPLTQLLFVPGEGLWQQYFLYAQNTACLEVVTQLLRQFRASIAWHEICDATGPGAHVAARR